MTSLEIFDITIISEIVIGQQDLKQAWLGTAHLQKRAVVLKSVFELVLSSFFRVFLMLPLVKNDSQPSYIVSTVTYLFSFPAAAY